MIFIQLGVSTVALLALFEQSGATETELAGWCETSDGRKPNSGTRQLISSSKDDCYRQCKAVSEATGCESYIEGDICTVHTGDVARASRDTQHPLWRYYRCWIFNSEPSFEETKIVDNILTEVSSSDPILPIATTTPSSSTLPEVCHDYSVLDAAWRHIDYFDDKNNGAEFPQYCDKTGSDSHKTYTNLTWGVSWYRFAGDAGAKLPTSPAPLGNPRNFRQICGTYGVAYIVSGGNPTIQDGIVTRDVCFEWYNDYYGCRLNTTVKVAPCKDTQGEYFVYQLQPAPTCNSADCISAAYCAID